jgi:hypothetical protein
MDGIVKVIWQQKDCDIEAGHKSRCNHNSQACEAAFADYDNLGSTCFTAEAGFGTSLFKLPQILVPTVLMLKTFPPYPHRDWMFDVVCPKIMHEVVAQNLIFKLTGCKMTQGLNKSGFRERDMLILKIVQASMKKVQSSKV